MSDHRTTDELARVLWDYNNLNHKIRAADCILALGSHDISVAHRAADLFLHDFARWIVFSGNLGRLTEDMWDQPEADIFAEEAIRMVVPSNKILIENRSTNTGENIRLTKELLASKGLSVETVILVQKPYMQRRAYATFKKVWPDKDVIVTALQFSFEEYPYEDLVRLGFTSHLIE